MKSYNVGIVGYSWVAGAHIDAINKTSFAQVTAICSSRNLDSAAIKAAHGYQIKCYTDITEMLADPELHVISICSYPSEHAQQAILAAKAGKHLIIEKPLALNWSDCLAVRDAVTEAGVKTCVCFECRFSSQLLVVKSVIDKGLVGKIHYGEVDYYHGIGPWYGQYRWNTRKAVAGSSLLSAGCHALDALLLLMGNEVEAVNSFATNSSNEDFAKYDYPTTSVSILKFKNGSIGKVASVIDCLQPYYFHIHLVGSEGSLLDNKFHSTQLHGLNKNKWSELSMKMLDSGDVSDHPYQMQFETFFQSLAEGKEMPLTNLAEALHTHEVMFAADNAAAQNSLQK